ncbi:hypothetical protein chiPu_0006666 [Chiloscyllium punctatum]|uniref:Uncharacterized protein n=1 Tax=Chiloscyllium punctatum TaxID=137246 RepID=A0A401SCU2_CHIPU|nr:hypothetical protein [Chiloscyllium punctatum]
MVQGAPSVPQTESRSHRRCGTASTSVTQRARSRLLLGLAQSSSAFHAPPSAHAPVGARSPCATRRRLASFAQSGARTTATMQHPESARTPLTPFHAAR